jgi:hypothetical protein
MAAPTNHTLGTVGKRLSDEEVGVHGDGGGFCNVSRYDAKSHWNNFVSKRIFTKQKQMFLRQNHHKVFGSVWKPLIIFNHELINS